MSAVETIPKVDTVSAHIAGYCELGYTHDDAYIVTGGYDNYLRCFRAPRPEAGDSDEDDMCGTLDVHHADSVSSLATQHGRYVASASQDGSVVLYAYERGADGDVDVPFRYVATVLRLRLPPVHSMVFAPSQDWLLAGCEDGLLRCVSLKQDSARPSQHGPFDVVAEVQGHRSPVLSLACHPLGQGLASMETRGCLKLWAWRENARDMAAPECVQSIEGAMPHWTSAPGTAHRMAWSVDALAVPTGSRLVSVYVSAERGGKGARLWREGGKASCGPGVAISAVAWSGSGQFLAGLGGSVLCVWDVRAGAAPELIKVYDHGAADRLTALAWSTAGTTLSFMDDSGQLGHLRGIVAGHAPHEPKGQRHHADAIEALFEEESDVATTRAPAADDKKQKRPRGTDTSRHSKAKKAASGSEEEDGDASEDDPEEESMEMVAEKTQLITRRPGAEGPLLHLPPRQPSFNSGSTSPAAVGQRGASAIQRWYLVWNMVGIITARRHRDDDDGGDAYIDIEFHGSRARPVHFQDHYGFTLAALTAQAAVFAAPVRQAASGPRPSLVYYIPFDAWAAKSEWTLSLDTSAAPHRPLESVVCLALGRTLVVAATDHNLVRVFSFSGLQQHVFSAAQAAAPLLTMAMRADVLFSVYHTAVNELLYDLYDLGAKRYQARAAPLPAASGLAWIGFMDPEDGAAPSTGPPALVAVDGAGVVRLATPGLDYQWTPILDTAALGAAGTSPTAASLLRHCYWVIGATSSHLVCVAMKGIRDAPAPVPPVLPRPLIQNIVWQLPLVSPEPAELALHTALLVHHHAGAAREPEAGDASTARLLDRKILECILLAIEAEKYLRVMDLCIALALPRSFEIAERMAANKKLRMLAERIALMREAKFGGQGEDSGQDVHVSAEAEAQRGPGLPSPGELKARLRAVSKSQPSPAAGPVDMGAGPYTRASRAADGESKGLPVAADIAATMMTSKENVPALQNRQPEEDTLARRTPRPNPFAASLIKNTISTHGASKPLLLSAASPLAAGGVGMSLSIEARESADRGKKEPGAVPTNLAKFFVRQTKAATESESQGEGAVDSGLPGKSSASKADNFERHEDDAAWAVVHTHETRERADNPGG